MNVLFIYKNFVRGLGTERRGGEEKVGVCLFRYELFVRCLRLHALMSQKFFYDMTLELGSSHNNHHCTTPFPESKIQRLTTGGSKTQAQRKSKCIGLLPL